MQKLPLQDYLVFQLIHNSSLTYSECCTLWGLTTSTIADSAVVTPFIWLLHSGDGECGAVCSWEPLHIAKLPSFTPLSTLQLPLVTQRLCSSGFDSKCNAFARNSILQLLRMNSDSGRISCMYRYTFVWHFVQSLLYYNIGILPMLRCTGSEIWLWTMLLITQR